MTAQVHGMENTQYNHYFHLILCLITNLFSASSAKIVIMKSEIVPPNLKNTLHTAIHSEMYETLNVFRIFQATHFFAQTMHCSDHNANALLSSRSPPFLECIAG